MPLFCLLYYHWSFWTLARATGKLYSPVEVVLGKNECCLHILGLSTSIFCFQRELACQWTRCRSNSKRTCRLRKLQEEGRLGEGIGGPALAPKNNANIPDVAPQSSPSQAAQELGLGQDLPPSGRNQGHSGDGLDDRSGGLAPSPLAASGVIRANGTAQ